MVERSLSNQRSAVRIQSSANFYLEHIFTVNCIEKTKTKEKRLGMAHFRPQKLIIWAYTAVNLLPLNIYMVALSESSSELACI